MVVRVKYINTLGLRLWSRFPSRGGDFLLKNNSYPVQKRVVTVSYLDLKVSLGQRRTLNEQKKVCVCLYTGAHGGRVDKGANSQTVVIQSAGGSNPS